jgi:hypothetical protein
MLIDFLHLRMNHRQAFFAIVWVSVFIAMGITLNSFIGKWTGLALSALWVFMLGLGIHHFRVTKPQASSPNEGGSVDPKYSEMATNGATPHEIYIQVSKDTNNHLLGIPVICQIFGLDLSQAKEVMLQANGTAPSLYAHLDHLAQMIAEPCKDIEEPGA